MEAQVHRRMRVGASLEEARARYLGALRALPPWGHGGACERTWAAEAPDLFSLILESLVASWRRLARIRDSLSLCCGMGPFLGALLLPVRTAPAALRLHYAGLAHALRQPAPPSAAELDAEADALPRPPLGAVVPGMPASAAVLTHAPTGRAEDGWFSFGATTTTNTAQLRRFTQIVHPPPLLSLFYRKL